MKANGIYAGERRVHCRIDEGAMTGGMMDFPLTLDHILRRAGQIFPESEVVSRLPDRTLHRYRYAEFHRRANRLAGALQGLGLVRGDRVSTLMWNHHVHLEAYFGVPCAGGVLHTVNMRLHTDDVAYIINHAGSRFLLVDGSLLPLYRQIADRLDIGCVIVVHRGAEELPVGAIDYEWLLEQAPEPGPVSLGELDCAGLCYTSGTTGRPKGVAYTHRSTVLHALATAGVDAMAIGHREQVCPVVPMFHVNAWGLPYTAIMTGAKLVLPGPHLDGASLVDLFEREDVTLAAGVPTIWASVLQVLQQEPRRKLDPRLRMVVGGAAVAPSMIRDFEQLGIGIVVGWGMTETSPVGTVNVLKRELEGLPDDERRAVRAKAGIPLPLFEVRAIGANGETAWNGTDLGELEVRGPWVASGYYNVVDADDRWTGDGWFRTGDIATVSAEGYVHIADRVKDLVKSGGEWISSVDLENALLGHPDVKEAAVIGVPHPKWGERPMAIVVLRQGRLFDVDALREHLAPQVARHALPDAFVSVDALPRTSTGKVLKNRLREMFSPRNSDQERT